ncbi:MAG: pentapeptide repeat-containing protein, partial [Megasphaera micronuciformis]|nr:pentapeptide repeat-containing protein [Megasphaera micronuciformis]
MKMLTLEDMRQLSTMTKAERQTYSCRESQLDGVNLDGLDLSGLDFSWSDFRHVSFV